ncbi:MAG TPA: Re/Si-specific NAD(P)(+) transhydrogenase subunit alpha [Bacteroidales bacterium]|nr:Re/Si-specific NAD(P)(+) transhydrogenase subunit alpha [Bacteroidales bacterium]
MKIGILKEKEPENRVAVMPETAASLTQLNVEIMVEIDAGVRSFVSDSDYQHAGAKMTARADVIENSDLLLFINPLIVEEFQSLDERKILIGAMNPFFNRDLVGMLVKKKITSFSLELLPRTSKAQAMDILSSMATIAGYKAILDAARNLGKFFPMFMSAAGTIKPAKVLILGAGVAGLQAIAIARKLGAVVEVFDVRYAAKEEVKSLGGKFIEVEGAMEDAAAGGYAVEQTEEFRQKQSELIHQHAVRSDVVICTAQIPGRKAPVLLKKTTVDQMKPGSVIIDLAASTGGNCELTKNSQTVVYNQIKIIGNSSYPSEMSYDASSMFSRNVFNFVRLLIDDKGNLNLDFNNEIIKGTCLTHDGEIVHSLVKEVINQ